MSKKKYTKATQYQVKQVLKSMTGVPAPEDITTIENVFLWYIENGFLNIPEDTFLFIPERPLVLGEVMKPRTNTLLTNYLDSYLEHTFIVMDAVQSSKEAMYIVRFEEYVNERSVCKEWLTSMQQDLHLVVSQYKTDIIVAARVKSFVTKNNL